MLVLLREYAGQRPFATLFVLCLCLFLPGCGAKLPDSGTLPSVAAGRGTPCYLEVTGQGIPTEGLAAAIRKEISRSGDLREADSPGPGTLTVRVNVEEIFLFGPAGVGLLDGLKTTAATLLIGILAAGVFIVAGSTDLGIVFPVAAGTLLGLGAGIGISANSWSKDVWAIRAGVGMAWHGTPDSLEEIVVSTGNGGASSREEATGMLEHELARRISKAIATLPQPS